MRLLGSKTSIFSTRSMAIGDMLGNFSEKGCFGTQGSCLTYFLALSLLRNPRSESSGEPNSYFGITRKIFISDHHNKIHRINTMPIYATCPDIFYKQSSYTQTQRTPCRPANRKTGGEIKRKEKYLSYKHQLLNIVFTRKKWLSSKDLHQNATN